MTPKSNNPSRAGFISATLTFVFWGLLPIYWKGIRHVVPFELLCHRVVWSLVLIGIVLTVQGRWPEVKRSLSSPQTVALLCLSSVLVAINWFVYIYAVNTDHVLETSLGYYINPLVLVLLGFVFFKDRLRPVQVLAIVIAAAGVVNLVWAYGRFPWMSLILAFSFAFYGLIRKKARVESLPGLLFETGILGLPMLGYLVRLDQLGTGAFGHYDLKSDLLLIGAGIVTTIPLTGFAYGARRLRLATLGVLQYLAPSIAFLLGVFVYREPLSLAFMATFVCIWVGLALYTVDSLILIRSRGNGHAP